nr:3919_t:CDS:10 [Entrophospora candida]
MGSIEDEKGELKLHTQNFKHVADNESIYSRQSSIYNGLSQRRHSKNKNYPYVGNHPDCQYIAASHDGEFFARFNSDTFELEYYKTGNITKTFPINNNIQKELKLQQNLWWSLTVSNTVKLGDSNDDVLIALSCFEDEVMKSSTTEFYSSSVTSDYEKGNRNDFEDSIRSRTWVFSAVYKKQIQTTIDNIGGIVRFLDNVASPYSSRSNKDSDSNLELELILMNSSGIYKSIIYPQLQYKIPKCIMNLYDVDYKSHKEFLFPPTVHLNIKKLFQDEPCTKYVESCVDKNYFFSEDYRAQKVDVYNLHTGDLEISLQKRVPITKASALLSSNTAAAFSTSSTTDSRLWSNYLLGNESIFSLSKYENMIAHCSNSNVITLYLAENGLEIATKLFPQIFRILFITFIDDDTKLFVVAQNYEDGKDKTKFITTIIIWDIFGTSNFYQTFDADKDSSLACLTNANDKNFFTSSFGRIYSLDENGNLFSLLDHPDVSHILKSNEMLQTYFDDMTQLQINNNNDNEDYHHMIYNLDKSFSNIKENKGVLIINNTEPWNNKKKYKRISVFLNDERTTQLIIGRTTIQVWQIKITKAKETKKRVLKYIWTSLGGFDMESISIGKNKFSLKISLCSLNSPTNTSQHLIYYPNNPNTIKDACEALEFLHTHRNLCIGPKNHQRFEDIFYNTEKLAYRCFKKSPSLWRLNDIRHDIMANLIRGHNNSLIKKILFNDNDLDYNKPALKNNKYYLHTPRLYRWPKQRKITDLELAIDYTKAHKDTAIVGFLLEYYSNHAMENVGWMFTVAKAIPLLLNCNLEIYLKGLLHKPCFGTKEVLIDRCFIDTLELMKGEKESVVPLTAKPRLLQKATKKPPFFHYLFYRKSEIGKYMEDDNEMAKSTSVRIVPLPDFLVYPNGIKDEKLHPTKLIKRLLKLIFWPRGYVIKEESDRSPFLKVLRQKRNELMYNNPSLEACIKFKFSSAKHYYIRHLIHYLFYALMISLLLGLIAIPYSGDENNTPTSDSAIDYLNEAYDPKASSILLALTAYLSYYLLAIEIIQVKQDKIKRYFNFYNFIDAISVVLPFLAVFGNYVVNIKKYTDSLNFIYGNNSSIGDMFQFLSDNDNNGVSKTIAIVSSFVVLILWLEFLLLLRFFSRPAYFINLIIDIVKSIWPFLVFMLIVIFGFGHAMHILLRNVKEFGMSATRNSFNFRDKSGGALDGPFSNITIQQDFNELDESDNFFVSFFKSVEVVYFWPTGRWDQVDHWDFWPVDVLSIRDVLLVIVMQNLLIAFMTGVFEDANNNVKQKTLKIRADLLSDYETIEKPFGNTRGNPRFVYYVGRADDLEEWNRLIVNEKSLLRMESEASTATSSDFDSFDYRKFNISLGGTFKYGLKAFKIIDIEFNHILSNRKDHCSSSNEFLLLGRESPLSPTPLSSLQNEVNEMKKFETDVSNRITKIENSLEEIIKLIKSKQA